MTTEVSGAKKEASYYKLENTLYAQGNYILYIKDTGGWEWPASYDRSIGWTDSDEVKITKEEAKKIYAKITNGAPWVDAPVGGEYE